MSRSKHLDQSKAAIRKFLSEKEDLVDDLCNNLVNIVEGLAEADHDDIRLASFRRDLTYLSETSKNEGESRFCLDLCLYLNFSVTSSEETLEGEFNLN
jgi:hypothetical protein